jgi:hypothetical protein
VLVLISISGERFVTTTTTEETTTAPVSPTMGKELELVTRFVYQHCTDIGLQGYANWRNILFTDAALTRLGTIFGYAVACWECGQHEFANKFAKDICSQLDRLNESQSIAERFADTDYASEFDHDRDSRYNPYHRVILFDDGTKFGFCFCVYYCIPPSVYRQQVNKELAKTAVRSVWYDDNHSIRSKRKDVDRLYSNVITNEFMLRADRYDVYRQKLSQVRCESNQAWFKESMQKQYRIEYRLTQRYEQYHYRPSYNGGLLYHGPGAGAVFAVDIGRTSQSNFWSTHT